MKNGWTGGQFSLVRAVYALPFIALGPASVLEGKEVGHLVVGAVAFACGLALFLGVYTRALAALALAAWVVLVLVWSAFVVGDGWLLGPRASAMIVVPPLLTVWLLVPRAPYGSRPARGRADPSGRWEFPPVLFAVLWGYWIVFVGYYVAKTLVHWDAARAEHGASVLVATELGLAFLVAAWFERYRPTAWLALVGCVCAGGLDGSGAESYFAFPLLAWTFDPAWIAPRWTRSRPIVFFDGECALCHGFVRFAIAEDRDGTRVGFAPLQGATAERELAASVPRADSVIVLADGELHTRSRAVARVLEALGGFWRVVAWLLYLVPRDAADRTYDYVAARRKRWFPLRHAACPNLTPKLAERIAP